MKKKKDYYKKTKELYHQFNQMEYGKGQSNIWKLIIQYINSFIRMRQIKKLNIPDIIMKNERKMVAKNKQRIIDRVTFRLRCHFQFENDYKLEKRIKEPLIWKDYYSAEDKLLHAIFKKINITKL